MWFDQIVPFEKTGKIYLCKENGTDELERVFWFLTNNTQIFTNKINSLQQLVLGISCFEWQ
jgi:hypothetical protein